MTSTPDRGLRADLRSDTVTRPTPAMREAMASAPVGDDVYGEDPTTNALESKVARMLGHEAGMFTPTGSLANVLGVRLLVEPGRELLCDSLAHVVRAELGAHAVHGGVTTRTWSATTALDVDAVRALLVPDAGPYQVSTAAVAVENTHNFLGGVVQPLAVMQELREVTAEAGVAVHLDGARLWNAAVATGTDLAEYGACADTVSVCLSKGLGAPVGSVLVGSAERIARARIWRKRIGAGMRQTGILAAAGIHALEHHVNRLADDHRRAQLLAKACSQGDPTSVDPDAVETNIVVLRVEDAKAVSDAALERGVAVSVLGRSTARLVTHLDVDDEAVAYAAEVMTDVLESRRR